MILLLLKNQNHKTKMRLITRRLSFFENKLERQLEAANKQSLQQSWQDMISLGSSWTYWANIFKSSNTDTNTNTNTNTSSNKIAQTTANSIRKSQHLALANSIILYNNVHNVEFNPVLMAASSYDKLTKRGYNCVIGSNIALYTQTIPMTTNQYTIINTSYSGFNSSNNWLIDKIYNTAITIENRKFMSLECLAYSILANTNSSNDFKDYDMHDLTVLVMKLELNGNLDGSYRDVRRMLVKTFGQKSWRVEFWDKLVQC